MPEQKNLRDNRGDVVLYRTRGGQAALEVKLEQETVWLSLRQIADLFGRDNSVISRHLRNIFISKELRRSSVVAFFATTAADGKTYQVEYYNLDAIISVGYRINSKRGTEFRLWATSVLHDHILKGYTLNEKRLKEEVEQLKTLKEAVDLMGRMFVGHSVSGTEAEGLLKIITDYSLALRLLDKYDHRELQFHAITEPGHFILTYEAAIRAVGRMAESMGPAAGLFGREKDKGLASAIGAIYQTWDGQDLYPSIEEKATRLLYFIVKNHAFVDGNKRIGAFLFIWFLDANGLLYRQDGAKRLADNALVALTLLIAQSKPTEKEIICKMVVNLINRENP